MAQRERRAARGTRAKYAIWLGEICRSATPAPPKGAGVAEGALVARHATGDWGEVCAEDGRENESSVARGFRILSSYVVAGEKVWLITKANRSGTTILPAWEY